MGKIWNIERNVYRRLEITLQSIWDFIEIVLPSRSSLYEEGTISGGAMVKILSVRDGKVDNVMKKILFGVVDCEEVVGEEVE